MNNLFILHTQYNIILGTGIMLNRYKDAQNDLIIYAEFKVSAEYEKLLNSLFNRVLFIRREYKPIGSKLSAELLFNKEYSIYRKSFAFKERYDNVFISQDQPLDCLIFGCCRSRNKVCKSYNIEEDVYYSYSKHRNDLSYVPKKQISFIHLLRRVMYGKNYIFETGYRRFSGQSSFFDGYYVLYPDVVRIQLKDKTRYEITRKELLCGISALYKTSLDIPKADKYYLFFFDLLERYVDPEGISMIFKKLSQRAISDNAVLLAKYHPREKDKFPLNSNVVELPAIVPAESVLCNLIGKEVTVFGNATTSVIVANKMGFKTISIAKINHSDNPYLIQKLSEMGIFVPQCLEEI